MAELNDIHTIICGNCGKNISARIPDMVCPQSGTAKPAPNTPTLRESAAYAEYIGD